MSRIDTRARYWRRGDYPVDVRDVEIRGDRPVRDKAEDERDLFAAALREALEWDDTSAFVQDRGDTVVVDGEFNFKRIAAVILTVTHDAGSKSELSIKIRTLIERLKQADDHPI